MTPTQRKALEQALECLQDNWHYLIGRERREYLALYNKAIGDAEAALAEQPEQEPVSHIGWLVRDADGRLDLLTDLQIESSLSKYERLSKLYTAPQPAKPAEQEPVAPRGLVWDCVSHPKGGWEVSAHFDVPLDDGAILVAYERKNGTPRSKT